MTTNQDLKTVAETNLLESDSVIGFFNVCIGQMLITVTKIELTPIPKCQTYACMITKLESGTHIPAGVHMSMIDQMNADSRFDIGAKAVDILWLKPEYRG